MAGKRVVFTFDERALHGLQTIQKRGSFSSLAEAVRESLYVSGALQDQQKKGFTEILVRNPETDEARVLVVPPLYHGKHGSED